jgi:zinc protease
VQAAVPQVTGDVPYTYVLGQVQMKPEKKDLAIKLMRDEMLSIGKTVDAGTLKDIQAKMIKDADENAKENSYWMNVLSMYVGRGIDLYTNYKSIVSSLTPQSIKDFVNKVILSSGNEVEVTMLPAE